MIFHIDKQTWLDNLVMFGDYPWCFRDFHKWTIHRYRWSFMSCPWMLHKYPWIVLVYSSDTYSSTADNPRYPYLIEWYLHLCCYGGHPEIRHWRFVLIAGNGFRKRSVGVYYVRTGRSILCRDLSMLGQDKKASCRSFFMLGQDLKTLFIFWFCQIGGEVGVCFVLSKIVNCQVSDSPQLIRVWIDDS